MKYDTPESAVVLHAEHSTPRGVLDMEYSVLIGCFTQSTVHTWAAAHGTWYSHRSAGYGV